jgi:hypothetical protein
MLQYENELQFQSSMEASAILPSRPNWKISSTSIVSSPPKDVGDWLHGIPTLNRIGLAYNRGLMIQVHNATCSSADSKEGCSCRSPGVA